MWADAARERYRDDGRRYPSDLTDAEWQTVEPVLRSYATLTVDLREMVNACLYLEKAGCPWRFLPKEFGPWQSVRTWHDRFRVDGIWTDIGAEGPSARKRTVATCTQCHGCGWSDQLLSGIPSADRQEGIVACMYWTQR